MSADICPSRDDAQQHIYEHGRCVLCLAPVPDDIDSRDKVCSCGLTHTTDRQAFTSQQDCPKHGIAASNARQNRYWQRVGGHD